MIDPHTHQYLDRMKDEPIFLALAQKVSDYLGRQGDNKGLTRIALRRVEHFYYKTQPVYEAMRKLAAAQQQAQDAVQVRASFLAAMNEEMQCLAPRHEVDGGVWVSFLVF